MFRLFFTTSLIALGAPAFAETFTTQARVDTVTIYPGIATVTRQITLDVPEGRHDIIVPDLPQNLSSEGLRIAAPNGVQVGAVNLAYDRLPVTPDLTSSEVQSAKDDVARLEAVVRDRSAAIEEIRLRASAAGEQIAFLQSLSQSSTGETLTAAAIADIQALAQMVGSETLRVRQEAFAAEQEARAAERAREDDLGDLNAAKQALAALMAPRYNDGSVLTFTVTAAQAGEVTLDISAVQAGANWSPTYDMRLSTGAAARLDIDRSVVVSQRTGEDWLDVKLVLSTARPGEQIAPSAIWAPVSRIMSEDELARLRVSRVGVSDVAMSRAESMSMEAAPVIADQAFGATANFSGATVTYTYPGTVNIRNGVENLQLPLDTLTLEAEVWAEAAPSRDTTAYRMANFINTTDEILLPGKALMFADGTMIGFSQLPMLAAGADADMGFGPLDGILLNRVTPSKSEGDVGVFVSANQLQEASIMTVENVTGQDWKILLRDAIPYSEQDDLEVEFTARPAIARSDPDGQRGILEWDLDLAAGEKMDVALDYTLTWPSGYVLQ